MSAQLQTDAEDLFYEGLIAAYVDAPGTVPRDWFVDEVRTRLALPSCRYVLLIGEPGAGKTDMVARLARTNPDWLRYFIRADSTTPLSGGDAVSMMLRIGHQLASRRPEIFDPDLLEIDVRQRVETAGPDTVVTGVRIEDLQVSPFHRTAIRVQQNVKSLSGGLTGVEIAQATTEPRLLELDTLGELALLGPAVVLARNDPDATIVVLVDALDEVIGVHGAPTVLDWLESGPELPPNVRFVLSSRPHRRLEMLESVRQKELERIAFDHTSTEVMADVRSFAGKLFDDTGALSGEGLRIERECAVMELGRAAAGNFAYLTAYARSLRAALAANDTETLDELLRFEVLPEGLHSLYASLIRRARRQIEKLGQLEIESPRGPDDEFVPAWEGAGQRLLSVLAVARAPLSLDQLTALGAVRVWKSAVGNVLQRLVPFLDEADIGWRLFHPSVGEFLCDPDVPDASDIAVSGHEWNARIVRHYRAGTPWQEVNWAAMDDYGLLHLIEHVAECSDDSRAVSELVTPGLRMAAKDRFHSNLPFRRIVERASASVAAYPDHDTLLPQTVFLELALSGLKSGAARLDPAVYGLMARLGRVQEALARAEVLQPGLHKYRALEAIRESTPHESRGELGPIDGIELLVGAALEIPLTASPIMGALGMDRQQCLRDAALAMAPHDVERALALADLVAEDNEETKERDKVLAAAARIASAEEALELVSRMGHGRAEAAAEAALKAQAGAARTELTALADSREYDPKERPDRLRLLSRVLLLHSEGDPQRAEQTRADLLLTLRESSADEDEPSFDWYSAAIDSAELLHDAHPDLAKKFLRSCEVEEVDSGSSWAAVSAARVWASWGQDRDCRRLLEKALVYFRGLGWYGPAEDIARVAVVAASIDRQWGDALATEAIALVETAIGTEDVRVDIILAGIVGAFRDWDRARALHAADWMTSKWVHGSDWDSTNGRGSAHAVIGLDAADDDRDLSERILGDCLGDDEAGVRLGRADSRLVHSGLFQPAPNGNGSAVEAANTTTWVAYLYNSVRYWLNGRDWRFFPMPADVLRSVESPNSEGASWARAVAAAVIPVATIDLECAVELVSWLEDPCERLVGLAGLAAVLQATNDPRLQSALHAIERVARELPRYEAQIDLDEIPQQSLLLYLDPAVRACFEAAVLLPGVQSVHQTLLQTTRSWYAEIVWKAELTCRELFGGAGAEVESEVLEAQVEQLVDAIGNADELVCDLLFLALSYALAPRSAERARAVISRISNRSVRASASLYSLERLRPDTPLAEASLQLLHELPEDVSPLHRAELAAIAVEVCESGGEDASAPFQWGLSAMEEADALSQTRGLTALFWAAPESQRATLLSRALKRADSIINQYLRNDALADLLGPTVAAADPPLVILVVRRLVQSGWRVLMEGLQRGMPELVDTLGAAVVEQLDQAMRRGQVVLGSPEAGEHLDGVATPERRTDVLVDTTRDVPAAHPAYLSTYLDQDDFGPRIRLVQNSRQMGADPDDEAFLRLGGQQRGLAVWMGDPDQTLWRVVDIRFLFGSPEDAAAYHRERLDVNSEGRSVVENATLVGEECSVFGGTERATIEGTTIELTSFIYVFRVDNLVAKLFVAQGPMAIEPLEPDHLVHLARRIVERIRSAFVAADPNEE